MSSISSLYLPQQTLLILYLFQLPASRILPGGQRLEAICCQLALIQAAGARSCSLGYPLFLRGHRRNAQPVFAVLFMPQLYRLAEDFFGEIIPADIAAFIGSMVIA